MHAAYFASAGRRGEYERGRDADAGDDYGTGEWNTNKLSIEKPLNSCAKTTFNPVAVSPFMPTIRFPWKRPSAPAGSTRVDGNNASGSPGFLPITRKPAAPFGG